MTSSREATDILYEAMQIEQACYSLYCTAATQTRDPTAVRLFLTLARDEMGHLAKLETVSSAVSQGRECLVAPFPSSPFTRCILPSAAQTDATPTAEATEMAALDRVIQAERDSVDFYRCAKGKASHSASRHLYEYLLEQEEAHLNILIAEREHLCRTGLWFNYLELTLEAQG